MKNIGKILTGVLMALGLLLGGLVASTPAQARPDATTTITQTSGEVSPMVIGSRVGYTSCTGDGCGKPIYMTNTSGVRRAWYMGEGWDNVFQVCPYSIGQKLVLRRPNGTYAYPAYGQCYPTNTAGTWTVSHRG